MRRAAQAVQPDGIDHDVVQAVVQGVVEVLGRHHHGGGRTRGGDGAIDRHRLPVIDVVFAVVDVQFHRERFLVVEELADADVFLRIGEVQAEQGLEGVRHIGREVAGSRVADREVVAQFRLRNVDVRRRVLLAAVAPGEIPVFVLVDRLVKLAGNCVGCGGGIGRRSGCLRHQDALRQTGLASAQRQKSGQQAASEKGCVHGGGVGARRGGAQRGAHAKDLYFRRAPFGARQPPWNQVFRTRRSSSRIRQMAPTEIAQSATLKDGKCMPFQWKSRKSTT